LVDKKDLQLKTNVVKALDQQITIAINQVALVFALENNKELNSKMAKKIK
jgi:hypothetical protein